MWVLDYLDKSNRKLGVDTSVWEKLQIKRFARVGIKILTNGVLPLVFRITKQKRDRIAEPTLPVVVSLTSFPVRIGRVWMTIESILRQTVKPRHIVLWLSREQFPREEKDLPKSLLEQTSRGLIIRFVDGDVRSHKKYYYAFKEYTKYDVVTIDDDLLFPSSFLASLYACSLQHPNDVIASFGSQYVWDDSKQYISVIYGGAKAGDCGYNLTYGSGGGTLFKPAALVDQMDDLTKIVELCPTADDLYLNALTRISGFGVAFHQNGALLTVANINDVKLYDINGRIGDADSVNASQLKALIKYMEERFGKNPFRI